MWKVYTMKKVELLSPAGNFDALRGAIKAGADAVYLGGSQFGARAFAENFTNEEICAGIRMAHVFGVKIYLTVNTLVKEREFDSLYDFLLPFYDSGLDGVIVQDLGVLRYVKNCFPDLKLCASTQMTITGSLGAEFMKEAGCTQIVPARELSLSEMMNIKENTGVEVETFIHGAMCYCYSGQCLFSSILGGRSGNRGRCAQPCRLPYALEGEKDCYPLSMRDMCTIKIIPELINAGIDSFKIEGRMKKPAYAAGVTAIYRKYIDAYYANPSSDFKIKKKDMELLRSLYIRSEVGEGYYHQHNGRDMITLSSPAYSPTDEALLKQIEEKYVNTTLDLNVKASVELIPGEPAKLELQYEELSVTSYGDIVQEAMKQPLTEDKVSEQICKSGNTLLHIENIELKMQDAIFMPIRSLNELRRNAIAEMENRIIEKNKLNYPNRKALPQTINSNKQIQNRHTENQNSDLKMQITVTTKEQLLAALREYPNRIYLEWNLLNDEILLLLEDYQNTLNNTSNNALSDKTEFVLTTPYIVRQKDLNSLEQIKNILIDSKEQSVFSGILIRNLESLAYFRKEITQKQAISNHNRFRIILDANLYIWNRESLYFFEEYADEFYLPTECNLHEWRELLKATPDRTMKASIVGYGRIPMMISANCLKKTHNKCNKTTDFIMIKDRYDKQFPVYTNCRYCYNIIYNSVPLSLHKIFQKKEPDLDGFRLDFTTESEKETAEIIRYFKTIRNHYEEPTDQEYTTGHYKRGVE